MFPWTKKELIKLFISDIFAPNIAIIFPLPSGTAACIDFPLSFNKYKASSKFKASEQTKALYSPNE